MKVFAWERSVQRWLASRLAWAERPLAAINVAASEPVVLALALAAAIVLGNPFIALATLASPGLEQIAKEFAHRGRPRDETELGLPSGDVMIATSLYPHLLGVYAIPLIATIALARLVRNAHYPLDVVAGAALGAVLWRLA